MSILIKGMEMPFDSSFATIMILPDGTMQTRRGDPLPYTAVPIPPHGRTKVIFLKWLNKDYTPTDFLEAWEY